MRVTKLTGFEARSPAEAALMTSSVLASPGCRCAVLMGPVILLLIAPYALVPMIGQNLNSTLNVAMTFVPPARMA
jgi:hypothetical protein